MFYSSSFTSHRIVLSSMRIVCLFARSLIGSPYSFTDIKPVRIAGCLGSIRGRIPLPPLLLLYP